MNRSLLFAAFGLGFALIACSSSSGDDDTQGQSQDDLTKATAACSDKSCGDSCTLCPASDPSCIETAVIKECNAQGSCAPAPAVCSSLDAGPPAAYEPCGGKACGASCKVCDPADSGCFETAVLKFCQADGACEPTTPTCTPPKPYEPCANKACGDGCHICDPADSGCFETAVVKQCDAKGACTPAPAACNK